MTVFLSTLKNTLPYIHHDIMIKKLHCIEHKFTTVDTRYLDIFWTLQIRVSIYPMSIYPMSR